MPSEARSPRIAGCAIAANLKRRLERLGYAVVLQLKEAATA